MDNIQEYSKEGGYVSSLTFNNGQTIDIKANDIVIFVGPNNVGKSQSLKDIYELCGSSKNSGVVVSAINIKKSIKEIGPLLNCIAHPQKNGDIINFRYLGCGFNSLSVDSYQRQKNYGALRDVFVAYLNTESRLQICKPAGSISKDEPKTHPIQFAAHNYQHGEWLSNSFHRAFNDDLLPNTYYGNTIPLCIGKMVNLDGESFTNEWERQERFSEILDGYKKVHEQGDGVKSFTGILLYLMMNNYCTYLIDEPESFLHPPQAHVMGQIIGESLKSDQQAFISTHSEEVIKGLIDVAPDRIKIIRITRNDDFNNFAILDNEDFNKIWSDPLLKYSNIMSGLFHKMVIICESDADCKFYSIIDDYLNKKAGRYSENLYIHCGGKYRMAKVVKALKSLNIDVVLLPDFDVINNESIFKDITNAFNIEWETIKKDYKIIVSNIENNNRTLNRTRVKEIINKILNDKNDECLLKDDITKVQNAVKVPSKWEDIKKYGKTGLPQGEASAAFEKIDSILKEHKIFIVPVGELECFVRTIGSHGPDWVNKVLETYPNLDNSAYDEVKQFIGQFI